MTLTEDLSRSLVALEQDSTLIAVLEMSAKSWLAGGLVPGVQRVPEKKLAADPAALLRLLQRWREEAERSGRTIKRIVLAYEIGRDGFWLARWLRARGIEAYAIHPASVTVSRENKRAKTDRLDLAMLRRVFLGWLRGERDHCTMAAVPTLDEEDAKRPGRERQTLVGEQTRLINRMKSTLARLGIQGFKPTLRKAAQRLAGLRLAEGTSLPPHTLDEMRRDLERLALVRTQIKQLEQTRVERLQQAPELEWNAMVLFLARVVGLGIDTADTLVQEVFRRVFRDQRAIAGYVGITGSPSQSGTRRREKGLTRSGNARGSAQPDPAGLALPEVPEGLRPGAVVPGADCRHRRTQVQDDRGARPQAAGGAVAHGRDRRGPRRSQAAAGRLSGTARTARNETGSALAA